MAYYLRKALSFGPLRLNFSKSGIGLSAGVTGARVGIGPKGAYVHGGRHGLYYRKYLSSGKKSAKADAQNLQSGSRAYFVDTGLTYGKGIPQADEAEIPAAPDLEKGGCLAKGLLMLGVLMLFPGLFFWPYWIFFPAAFAILLGVVLSYQNKKQVKTSRALLEEIERDFEERKPVEEIIFKIKKANLPAQHKQFLDFHFFVLLHDTFYEQPEYIQPDELQKLEKQLVLPEKDKAAIKVTVFQTFLDEMMEDHLISAEEEQQLIQLKDTLQLKDAAIDREIKLMDAMVEMRRAMETEPSPLQSELQLKKEEKLYYRNEGKLLKEKIQKRFQRNNIQYKEIGYDVDMEGEVCLTSERILIIADGERSYSLDDVKDVTLSLEDNTLQLRITNRKNPLIFSMPDVPVFAGKLNHLLPDTA
ncbi:MAG: DUF4236 domain-containing protein [Chitinophagales bacterium]